MNGPFGSVVAHDDVLRARIESVLVPEQIDTTTPIGLIGCGWIGGVQLAAYRRLGLNVVALCDRHLERAASHAEQFFPSASTYTEVDRFLRHPGLEVVDIATHTDGRAETIRTCLRAGKHVLSQKPFVEDLEVGAALAADADSAGVVLAVNQNGRWAPHFAAMLAVVAGGIIGEVVSADFLVAWSHDRTVADKPAFASMEDLVLFDFGAHWFDIVAQLAPAGPLEVFAATGRRAGQSIPVPTQAEAVIAGAGFRSSIVFRAAERFVEYGGYRVSGTRGVVTHAGQPLGGDAVVVHTDRGSATITTAEDWFEHGLGGAMRAMLSAIRSGEPAPHAAPTALRGLTLCFAALESAATGGVLLAGEVLRRPAAPGRPTAPEGAVASDRPASTAGSRQSTGSGT